MLSEVVTRTEKYGMLMNMLPHVLDEDIFQVLPPVRHIVLALGAEARIKSTESYKTASHFPNLIEIISKDLSQFGYHRTVKQNGSTEGVPQKLQYTDWYFPVKPDAGYTLRVRLEHDISRIYAPVSQLKVIAVKTDGTPRHEAWGELVNAEEYNLAVFHLDSAQMAREELINYCDTLCLKKIMREEIKFHPKRLMQDRMRTSSLAGHSLTHNQNSYTVMFGDNRQSEVALQSIFEYQKNEQGRLVSQYPYWKVEIESGGFPPDRAVSQAIFVSLLEIMSKQETYILNPAQQGLLNWQRRIGNQI